MNDIICKHCGGRVKADQSVCPNCGLPLPPNHATQKQRTFIVWFVVLLIFCFVMMLWLPPDWSRFIGK